LKFQLGVTAGLGTALHNFLGQQSLSLRNEKYNPGGQSWEEMRISREEDRTFLPQIVQCCLNEADFGPRLVKLTNEQLKANMKMNAWQH